MRQGQNPAKRDVPAYSPQRLGIATLLYIPFQQGYYAQSLEIFKYHLASVWQYTPEPFDYLVFDNGSSPEVKRELQALHEEGKITWLVLSEHNLGKTGALNFILGGMPNEWICYADSDMLFRPGWLEESWKIEQAFPGCGMIGAQVVFADWESDRGNSRFRHKVDPRYHFEQVRAPDWLVEEYCEARGIQIEDCEIFRKMVLDRVTDVESGIQAILGGNSHQQFLARRTVLQEILPLPSSLQLNREEDTYQDVELDRRGYLHLTTTVPYLYHMGNVLSPASAEELSRLKQPEAIEPVVEPSAASQIRHPIGKLLVAISRRPAGRKVLTRLYDILYRVLS